MAVVAGVFVSLLIGVFNHSGYTGGSFVPLLSRSGTSCLAFSFAHHTCEFVFVVFRGSTALLQTCRSINKAIGEKLFLTRLVLLSRR